MKITSVDLYQVTSGKPSVAGTYWKASICRINTDEGISGFGEAGVCYSSGSDAALGLLKDYAQAIIGMNPMNNEQIWNKLHRDTFWGMGGGTIVFSAISAIDIALWDIRGKPPYRNL